MASSCDEGRRMRMITRPTNTGLHRWTLDMNRFMFGKGDRDDVSTYTSAFSVFSSSSCYTVPVWTLTFLSATAPALLSMELSLLIDMHVLFWLKVCVHCSRIIRCVSIFVVWACWVSCCLLEDCLVVQYAVGLSCKAMYPIYALRFVDVLLFA